MKLAEMASAVQAGASLESVIPEGSDPAIWRKMIANFLNGKKRRKSGSSWGGRKNSRRTNYAAQVVAQCNGLVETVKRVNEKPVEAIVVDAEAIPWQGEPVEMPDWLGEVGL